MGTRVAVTLETSPKKTFASANDWPGWSRSGKTAPDALAALRAYGPRYAVAATRVDQQFAVDGLELEVVETIDGGSGTAFGVPSRVSDADRRPTTAAEAERLARLVAGSWETLDAIASIAPEELRKGPRGGGRDKSKMIRHVLDAEHAYAREMGLRLPPPSPAEPATVTAIHEAILDVLRQPSDGSPLADRRWTARYAAHRIAWHVLDHAWEIEDRSEPE